MADIRILGTEVSGPFTAGNTIVWADSTGKTVVDGGSNPNGRKIVKVTSYPYAVVGTGANEDHIIECQTVPVGGVDVSRVNLPALSSLYPGKGVIIKGGDATIGVSNVLTVRANGSETIEDSFSLREISVPWGYIELLVSFDKTTWLVLSSALS